FFIIPFVVLVFFYNLVLDGFLFVGGFYFGSFRRGVGRGGLVFFIYWVCAGWGVGVTGAK
ncbi:hypothetical protein, partial [Enterobacter hormaechei]